MEAPSHEPTGDEGATEGGATEDAATEERATEKAATEEGATEERAGGERVAVEAEPEGGRRLVLEDVTIYEGSLDVRYPLSSAPGPESRIVTVPASDGEGLMRSLGFRGIDAHLARLSIIDPEVEGLRGGCGRVRHGRRGLPGPGPGPGVRWTGGMAG